MVFLRFIEPVEFVGAHTLSVTPPFFISPKPPHSSQTSNPSGVLANLPSPWQRGQKVILYFPGSKVLSISFLPPCPSGVYHLTRSHQLPILQDHRVNNLPTDQTFPSPKLFLETVKFVIDHDTPAAKTFRE